MLLLFFFFLNIANLPSPLLSYLLPSQEGTAAPTAHPPPVASGQKPGNRGSSGWFSLRVPPCAGAGAASCSQSPVVFPFSTGHSFLVRFLIGLFALLCFAHLFLGAISILWLLACYLQYERQILFPGCICLLTFLCGIVFNVFTFIFLLWCSSYKGIVIFFEILKN